MSFVKQISQLAEGACLRRGSLTHVVTVLFAAAAIGACGEIRVKIPTDAGPTDLGGVDISDDLASDLGTPEDLAIGTDAAPADTAGAGCSIDDDCQVLKGKGPCKVAACELATKTCKLVLRAKGEPCKPESDDLGECEEAKCDTVGACLKSNKPEKSVCGTYACGKKCAAGVCVVAVASDYDDGKVCTDDYCDQGKKIVNAPITDLNKKCDDGDKCTSGDACISGECKGQISSCDDNLACTFDTCAAKTGCTHTQNPTRCDDGNPCTKDGCDLAVGCTVTGFEVAVCDDKDACTTNDLCDKGACKGKGNAASCGCTTDGDCVKYNTNACLGKYVCTANKACALKEGSGLVCDTSLDTECSKTQCAAGVCGKVAALDGKPCNDKDACFTSSVCKSAQCKGDKALVCDDKNQCTSDSCDSVKGCQFVINTLACDDGSACTTNDTCAAAGCTGSPKACDDAISCTFDACDKNSGNCTHTGSGAACDDKNPCTKDSCDVATGCQHAADDSASCDDGNSCTKDTCNAGKCTAVVTCKCQVDLDCNDNNPCTKDSCGGGQCTNDATALNATPCDNGDKCQMPNSGKCTAGVCAAGGKPVDCSGAGDACNAGTCNPTTGKCESISKGDGVACDDQNGCTQSDSCQAGKCKAGPAVACPSGGPCFNALCQSTGATTHTCGNQPKPAGTPCDDGKFCSQGDSCTATGACAPGPLLQCLPSPEPCFENLCDDASQGCAKKAKPFNAPCDDGKYCTTGEHCADGGLCTGGTPTKCATTKACTQGYCDEQTNQCLIVDQPNCCAINGDCNDGNPCTADTCSANKCLFSAIPNCCKPVLWENHFDTNDLLEMTLVNSTQSPVQGWQLRPQSPISQSPPGVLWYGDPATNNFDFGPNQASSGTATVPMLKIGNGSVLKFNAYFDTEPGNTYDQFDVNLIDLTGQKITIYTKGISPVEPTQAWYVVSIPLDQFTGKSYQIQFLFNTIDGAVNNGQGVFIDDVVITQSCGGGPPPP